MSILGVQIGLLESYMCYQCYVRRIFPGLKNSSQLPNTRPGSLDPTYMMFGYNRLRSRGNAMGLCMSFVFVVRRSQNALLEVALSYSPKQTAHSLHGFPKLHPLYKCNVRSQQIWQSQLDSIFFVLFLKGVNHQLTVSRRLTV